jgi:hypothetical protein
MSSIDGAITHPVAVLSPLEQQKLSGKEPMAAAGTKSEKSVEQLSQMSTGDSDPDVVLVDYDEDDRENPLNWPSLRKWLIVFAVSWMGFVR